MGLGKKIVFIMMILIINLSTFSKEIINIGIIYSESGLETRKYEEAIKKEFGDILGGDFQISFSKSNQLVAAKNKQDILLKYNELVDNPNVDLIIGGDYYVSNIIVNKEEIKKLSIMPFLQCFSNKDTSEKKNLTYSLQELEIGAVVDLLRSVDNTFNEIVIISYSDFQSTHKEIVNTYKEVKTGFEDEFKENGISSIKWVYFNGDFEKLTNEIRGQKVAILGGIPEKEVFSKIVDILTDEKIISFGDAYENDLSELAYLSFNEGSTVKKRLRKSAISTLEILKGAKAENQSVHIISGEPRPVINKSIADRIGKWPDWRVAVSAKIVGDNSVGEELTLFTSIIDGLNNNLELSISRSELNAQEYRIDSANSNRLPQVITTGGYAAVDQGQAEAPNALKKENLYVGVGLRQVIWNDSVNSLVSIEKSLYSVKEAKYKQKELDTILKISKSFFEVLKLRAFENIQHSNLELTKQNLELARIREKIGASRKSDVYRWESKLATDLGKVSLAKANYHNAKEELREILNTDLDIDFYPLDIVDMDEFLGIAGLELTHQNVVSLLVDELIQVGIKNSYELKEIDGYLAVQERKLKEANRSFYSPKVAVVADYNYYIDRMGSGSLYASSRDGDPRKEAWTVGVEVSLPLLEGGGRISDKKVITEEMNKLSTKRIDVERKLTKEIKKKITNLVAAKISLENSKDAKIAAEKNLDLVIDSYSRGEVSITELLDSQNVAVLAKETESSAKYNYYIKLMEAERTIGSYHLLEPEVYMDILDANGLSIND